MRTRDVARAAGVLWLGCGGLALATATTLPFGDGADPGRVLAVGAVAAAVGALVWFLPWDRWGRRSTLLLVPVACGVIAAFNDAARDPWLCGLFFVAAFVWTGLAHRQGTCLAFSPLLVAAYLAPASVRSDAAGVASVVFAAPVAVVLGEVAAWVAGRLVEAETARKQAADRFAALLRHASELVAITQAGVITYASPGTERVLGYPAEDLLGQLAATLVHPDDLRRLRPWFEEEQSEDVATSFRLRHADGGWRWIDGSFSDLREDPAVGGVVINGRDVSERVAAEVELRHLALHDQLTALPNRTSFLRELERRSSSAVLHGEQLGLIYIDLDGFKVVNDSLGHSVGDDLLKVVADRLQDALPANHFVARLGGDEFVVILPTSDCGRATEVAAEIAEEIARPVELRQRQLVVGASMGIEVAVPVDTVSLLRNADLALYRAKALGRGRSVVFDDTLGRTAARRLDVETELRLAIERDELLCHYQPEVDLPTGRIVGAEALVRWQHPTRGLLGPADFIDVAEDSGLVVEIGQVVLRQACAMASRWRRLHPDFVVACNVSAQQLQDARLVDDLRRALVEHALPSTALRLEVTETALVQPAARDTLAALRAVGVSLAIDDFGTGYSSLSYLDQLSVDVLKIDKSFLDGVTDETDHLPVVVATLAMAKSMQLHVVAEGVETPTQVALLRRLGCPSAQGYYFGRPVLPTDISRRLAVAGGRPAELRPALPSPPT